MERKVTEQDRVKCPWCLSDFEAISWNDNTFKECRSREMRRVFRDIYNPQVWGRSSDHYYKCPSCGMWSKGNQLILLDESGEPVKGMGGQPIVRVTSNQE